MGRVFLGLSEEKADFNRARVALLPIPFERTTTYLKGTKRGPKAIIEASSNVELYDEELRVEPYKIGITTLAPLRPSKNNLVEDVCQASLRFLKKGKFLVSLGGEHSISIGLVRAHKELFPNLSVLQLDAHADLRESYLGSRYSHACTMARIKEICPYVGVGIRSLSIEEAERIEREGLKIIYAQELIKEGSWHKRLLSELSDEVYLTVDLDVLDPSIMPSVGTPEPGGIGWYQILSIIKGLAQKKKVVGFDVVELCPQRDNKAPDFLAARLVYKIIGYALFHPSGENRRDTPGH